MSKPENPMAFPKTLDSDEVEFVAPQPGMTLRDYFAGQCDVEAYSPAKTFYDARGNYPTIDELAAYITSIRFIEADAMLAERAKGGA